MAAIVPSRCARAKLPVVSLSASPMRRSVAVSVKVVRPPAMAAAKVAEPLRMSATFRSSIVPANVRPPGIGFTTAPPMVIASAAQSTVSVVPVAKLMPILMALRRALTLRELEAALQTLDLGREPAARAVLDHRDPRRGAGAAAEREAADGELLGRQREREGVDLAVGRAAPRAPGASAGALNSKLSKLRSKSPANRSAESSFSVAPSRRTPLSWMSSGSRAVRLLVRTGVPNSVAGVAARSSATVYVSFASVIVALAFSAMLPSATAAASGPRLRPALKLVERDGAAELELGDLQEEAVGRRVEADADRVVERDRAGDRGGAVEREAQVRSRGAEAEREARALRAAVRDLQRDLRLVRDGGDGRVVDPAQEQRRDLVQARRGMRRDVGGDQVVRRLDAVDELGERADALADERQVLGETRVLLQRAEGRDDLAEAGEELVEVVERRRSARGVRRHRLRRERGVERARLAGRDRRGRLAAWPWPT